MKECDSRLIKAKEAKEVSKKVKGGLSTATPREQASNLWVRETNSWERWEVHQGPSRCLNLDN